MDALFVMLQKAHVPQYLKKSSDTPIPTPSKPLSELTDIELMELLRKVEADIEMQKIKYQSCLTNPYCWPVTRDLVKTNLDSAIERKLSVVSELDKRKLSSNLN